MTPRAERSSAWNISLSAYEKAAAWIHHHVLEEHGISIVRIVHDPPAGLWRCYDATGQVRANVPHDLMERIMLAVEKQEWTVQDGELARWRREEEDGA